ncbi:hypothetical protein QWY87_00225 [Lutimonas halocynthiae]|uniref:hypothetical protein n=1 Tax=Lutimonas halocynthiae TaxID=1446477 RepID=UPI0025B5DB17|nr:hypothetical protein [Lutimonas halocynthiae]MDN3641107.1 hypothetical protein [Lutimonas halocynthiae]
MNKRLTGIVLILSFAFCALGQAQNTVDSIKTGKVTKLFIQESILPIKLSYSNKDIKKKTNDSTFIQTVLSYQEEDLSWKDLQVKIRRRGDFRLNNCYFAPIKMKIKKSASKGSLFEKNKKLKLAVKCSDKKGTEDYIVKEYMAYKIYEVVSNYHYKVRLADILLTEPANEKDKTFEFKGYFIEDIKLVAKRHGGQPIDRNMHPQAQDPVSSVQNAFFQFMIGNIDFSTYVQHNEKLIFVDEKVVPIPFDFDMSGLVNTSYATVSESNNESLPITSVTDRLYRGFKRDPEVIAQVRKEYLDKKQLVIEVIDSLQVYFANPKQFEEAKNYVLGFYNILEDDNLYSKEIINKLRTR